jgi:predicted lipoprotein with Yx(FWY)xxD motif
MLRAYSRDEGRPHAGPAQPQTCSASAAARIVRFFWRHESDDALYMFARASLRLFAALPLAALAFAGCGGSASHSLPTTNDGRPATLGVTKTNLGDVLVDRQERTLYLFARDAGMTSACTGVCAVNWPPVGVRGAPVIGSGAHPSEVGTTARPDGKSQLLQQSPALHLRQRPEARRHERVRASAPSAAPGSRSPRRATRSRLPRLRRTAAVTATRGLM